MSKEKILEFLRSFPNKYPSVMVYRELINLACRKFSINMKEAEKRYGLYDGRQWIELLEFN